MNLDKNEQELMNIIDEVASSAATLHQSPQNYDSFIRARESCRIKLKEYSDRNKEVFKAIETLRSVL